MPRFLACNALGGFVIASIVALTSSVARANDQENAPTVPIVTTPPAVAQEQIPSCSFAVSRLSPEQIQSWRADPQAWLDANPTGGVQMSNFVRSLVGSDSHTVAVLVDLTKRPATNASQRAAIGAGLARSAQVAQTSDPTCAAYVQTTVAKAGSPEAVSAFQAALSQVATEALGPVSGGGPAGGGAGPTGGGSLTGGGSAGNIGPTGGTSTVASSSGSYTVGGGSVSDGSTTRTVLASPVQ
jgi:hypothetical protein